MSSLTPPAVSRPGARAGGYVLEEQIGPGGMWKRVLAAFQPAP